jgi:DNA-binding CsgD family transcriptional regulator
LALAQSGAADETKELLATIGETTRENEARALSECARALIDLDVPGGDPSTLVDHFQTAVSRWVFDPYVFAFKLDQRLPRVIQRNPTLRSALDDLRPFIGSLVQRSGEASTSQTLEALSPREREVLGLVAEGLTNAEIASSLFLAVSTVKVHVRSVLRKLGLRTRTEAAVFAVTKRRHAAAEQTEPLSEPDDQE